MGLTIDGADARMRKACIKPSIPPKRERKRMLPAPMEVWEKDEALAKVIPNAKKWSFIGGIKNAAGKLRDFGDFMTGTGTRKFDDFTIEGSKEFCDKTQKALELMKDKAPQSYGFVSFNIGKIKQSDHSGMDVYADPPTFEVGDTWKEDLDWYASCMVHDAKHHALYFEEKHRLKGEEPPREAWTGKGAEGRCLDAQWEFLRTLGNDVTREEIEDIERNPTYQDIPYEERDW